MDGLAVEPAARAAGACPRRGGAPTRSCCGPSATPGRDASRSATRSGAGGPGGCPRGAAGLRPAGEPSRAARLHADADRPPLPGVELDAMLQQDQPLNATGSSTAVADPRVSGLAAVDGDPGTTWTADLDDVRPQLALNWLGKREIRGISLAVSGDAPARRADRGPADLARWATEGRPRRGRPGVASGPSAPTARRAHPRLAGARSASTARATGPGCPSASARSVSAGCRSRRWPCRPPDVWAVRFRADRGDRRRRGAHLPAGQPGGDLRDGGAGTRSAATAPARCPWARGRAPSGPRPARCAVPDHLRLSSGQRPRRRDARRPRRSGSVNREVLPRPGQSVVTTRENTNPGWVATQDGQNLDPVVVDGWQQGWRTDGGDDPVEHHVRPGQHLPVGDRCRRRVLRAPAGPCPGPASAVARDPPPRSGRAGRT